MGKDYYQILQLTRSAKDNDIKAAYVKIDYFITIVDLFLFFVDCTVIVD
jgi:hypothetical protein